MLHKTTLHDPICEHFHNPNIIAMSFTTQLPGQILVNGEVPEAILAPYSQVTTGGDNADL